MDRSFILFTRSCAALALFIVFAMACASPEFHPDAMSLQREAMKVYNRKPDSALALLDKAVQMDASFYLAYNTKAMIMQQSGDYDRAIAELHKSLSWKGDQAEVHLQLGMLNDALGRPERANDGYLRAIALYDMRITEPNEHLVEDRFNRAIALVLSGEEARGNALLDTLIAQHPDQSFLQALTKRQAERKQSEGDSVVFDKAFYLETLFERP